MHRCSHTIHIKQISFHIEFCLSDPSLGICPMFYRESPNPAVAAISMKFFDCFYHRLDMAAWCFKIHILRLWILSFLFFRGTCKCILRSKLANLLGLFCDRKFQKVFWNHMIKRQETPKNDYFAASRSRRCYLENYRCKAPIWAGWAPPVMNKRPSRARIWSELHTHQLATHARDTQTDGGTMNERSCSKRISGKNQEKD